MKRKLLAALLIITTIIFGLNSKPLYAANPDMTIYVYPAITNYRILPTTSISSTYISNTIKISGSPDEYRPASFVVKPAESISSMTVTTTDLTGPAGTIDSSAIDIKAVKCWYQAGVGSSNIHQNRLTPELLLNDDSLVMLDNNQNYLKLTDGTYKWISDTTVAAVHWYAIPVNEIPVQDSSTLQPVDITAGTNKQFWITTHIPQDASAGSYSGKISLETSGVVIGEIELQLTVYAIDLQQPLLNYSICYAGMLSTRWPDGSISHIYKSTEQLTAELADMVAHGISNPSSYQRYDLSLLSQLFTIRNSFGMENKPFYSFGLLPNGYQDPVEVANVVALAKTFNIPDVYVYGIDEAKGDTLAAQRASWEAIRKAGGKIFASGYTEKQYSPGAYESMGDLMDLFLSSGAPDSKEAAKWHSAEHQIFNYSNPQCGVEFPDLYRANYGLLLWQQNYDGAMNFAYQYGFGSVWNDFDDPDYRDHNMTYPTLNGVIGTIQWEGFREGVNDVRYLTTLINTIETAKAAGKDTTAAEAWLADLKTTELTSMDLNEVRSTMIDYILALQEADGTDVTVDHIKITPAGAESAASLIKTVSSSYTADMTEHSIPVNGQMVYTAEAFDSNDNPINGLQFTWSVTNAGTGSISSNGLFTAGTETGIYPDLVQAATTNGVTGSASVTVIESPLVNPGDQMVDEGQLLQFIVSGSGSYSGLTFSAANLPDGANFDPATQEFSWTPDYSQSGSYDNIRFQVTDGNYIATETISVTVTNINRAPVLSTISSKTLTAGSNLSFTISASDPDNDILTYSASNLPTGAGFNASTRKFSWTPAASQVGTYSNINFKVSDGKLTDDGNITLKVNNTNRAPVMDSIPNQTVKEEELLTFTVTAGDPDGDDLTYSAVNLPRGASFDADTQVFSWTPASSQVSKYNVRFSVTDGKLYASKNIIITVTDVKHAPVLDSIGNKTATTGTKLSFTISAGDVDGDKLTYSASNLPKNASFNKSTRVFSWTPAFNQSGTYNGIRFTVSDGSLSDYEDITVTVAAVNKAPVMTSIASKTVKAGSTLSFKVNATDANGDNLSYSADNLPDGAGFNAATQVFTWKPSTKGTFKNIRFNVTDGASTTYKTVAIIVK